MQAPSDKKAELTPKKEHGTPDRARIKRMVDAAADRCGGFRQLAAVLEVHPQLVSNWRNGVKTPSPEAQAEMASIAGHNVLVAGLMALIEKTDGERKKRLQAAYRQWTVAAAATLEFAASRSEPHKITDEDIRTARIEEAIKSLDQNDQRQADAAKMLQAVIDGLPSTEWRRL